MMRKVDRMLSLGFSLKTSALEALKLTRTLTSVYTHIIVQLHLIYIPPNIHLHSIYIPSSFHLHSMYLPSIAISSYIISTASAWKCRRTKLVGSRQCRISSCNQSWSTCNGLPLQMPPARHGFQLPFRLWLILDFYHCISYKNFH